MVSKEHEGRRYPPYRLAPDPQRVRAYWRSLGLPESDTPPLTFPIFLRGESQGVDLFRDLGIPREQALHGGQRYEWFAPVRADDALEVSVQVDLVTEKASKAGRLWFVDVTYDYRLVRTGELAVRELTRLIKREVAA
jgi:hypothetical protein